MKQMTCAAMGGPADCTTVIQGETPEEMVQNGMDHIETAHPAMFADVKKMTPEATQKWMDDFKVKYAALQDM